MVGMNRKGSMQIALSPFAFSTTYSQLRCNLHQSGQKGSSMNGDFILGKLLGRHEAFNIVAARCTAADAKLMRQIRNEKLYLGLVKDWGECCTDLMHTTKDTANRIIKCI